MSIQGNFNNGLRDVALAYGARQLKEINETLKQKGFTDYDDLQRSISQLKIQIAQAKDEGKAFGEQKVLLEEYEKLATEYEKAKAEAEEKAAQKRKANLVWGWVFAGISILICIITMIVLL